MVNHSFLTYRSDIQGLRAIAIILVIFSHSGIPFFSGGYIGVDVFFVLSGYLITGILIKEYVRTGNIQIVKFYSRRLKRLLPSLLAMITIVILLSSLLLSNFQFFEQTSSSIFAASWTSNLFFTFSTINYFSQEQSQDLFLHTWSLGVEEQFYLIWPVVLLFLFIVIPKQQQLKYRSKRLVLLLIIFFIISFGLSYFLRTSHPLWTFYMVPARIWQFAIGAGVYLCLDIAQEVSLKAAKQLSKWYIGLGILGTALIIISSILLNQEMLFSSHLTFAPSLGASLIIISGSNNSNLGINKYLSSPGFVWIGNRSYSLYLWHWPIFILGFSSGLQHNIKDGVTLILILMLLTILNYRLIELPFWKGVLSKSSVTTSILSSVLAITIVIIGIQQYNNHLNAQGTLNTKQNSLEVAKINHSRLDMPILYFKDCDSWFNDAMIQPCTFGNELATKTVLLIGDSIGAQWFSMLPELFSSPDWKVVVLTKSSCPIVDEDFYYSIIGKHYDVCTEWRASALEYISEIQPEIVFIGSSVNYGFSKGQWINGSARIYKSLTKFTNNIVVLAGTPKLSFNGPSCLSDLNNTHLKNKIIFNICGEKNVSNQASTVNRYIEIATQQFTNVSLLNLNDLVCPNNYCVARRKNGLIVFRDQQHLTNTFVRQQINFIAERLEQFGVKLGIRL